MEQTPLNNLTTNEQPSSPVADRLDELYILALKDSSFEGLDLDDSADDSAADAIRLAAVKKALDVLRAEQDSSWLTQINTSDDGGIELFVNSEKERTHILDVLPPVAWDLIKLKN